VKYFFSTECFHFLLPTISGNLGSWLRGDTLLDGCDLACHLGGGLTNSSPEGLSYVGIIVTDALKAETRG